MKPHKETNLMALTPAVGPNDHTQGPNHAPVTLVEYGDFQCPDCGVAYAIVQELQKDMGERLRYVFREFPLTDIHRHAEAAAEAAEAAGAQGKFWPMYDLLFRHQQALRDQDLRYYAEKIGLDMERFEHDLIAHVYRERIRKDMAGGLRGGVQGTPTFFINGVRHDDSYDLETLTDALEEASKR
jgi:protein-disulfide isomerase